MSGSTYSWVGGAGDFSDPGKWQDSTGGAPGPNDYAIIGSLGGGVVVSADALQVNYKLYLNAELDATSIDVSQRVTSGHIIGGILYVDGAPGLLSAPVVTVDGGTASLPATLQVHGTANGLYEPGAPATLDTGTLTVGASGFGLLEEGEGFPNVPTPGNVTVNGKLVVGDQAGSHGSVSISDATSVLTVNGVATIGNAGTGIVDVGGGTTLNAIGATVTLGSQPGSYGDLGVGGTELDFSQIKAQTLYPGSTFSDGNIIVGDAGKGLLSIGQDVVASVPGEIVLGNQATGNGELIVSANTYSGGGPSTELSVGQLVTGQGSAVVDVESGAILDAQTVAVGVSSAVSFLVDGTHTSFSVPDLTVGDEMPTSMNDQGNPDGTDGDWTYSGDTGTLTVSHNASVSAGQTLALLALAQIGTDGTVTTQGGIDVLSGGNIEVGGSAGAPANNLQIDNGGTLVGHGLINSDEVGSLPDTAGVAAGQPEYSLTLDNLGTIQAENGLLDIKGNVAGDGAALIDTNAAIEVSGTFGSDDGQSGTIDFQNMTGGTLILDDITDFHGNIVGLTDGTSGGDSTVTSISQVDGASGFAAIASGLSVVPQGANLAIPQSSTNGNYAVDYATMGDLNGTIELKIGLGPPNKPAIQQLFLPLPDKTPATIENEFFNVTQVATGALLTYTQGNPIDLAVDGPNARQTYGVNGAGITVGIISDGFGTADQIATAQSIGALPSGSGLNVINGGNSNDAEGLAMAEVVHAIAPGATIDFYTDGGNISGSGIVTAIQTLETRSNIIVDDDLIPEEPSIGSPVENQINTAISQYHVTYFTSAGNTEHTPVITGHALDRNVITVASMNWLAAPASSGLSVGGYLPTQNEFDSAPGRSPLVAKPNITAPDGGPTTLPLDPVNTTAPLKLNPFFGTSAAAPAAAAVAALMLQANRQLTPANVSSMLQNSATPFGAPFGRGGAGLVEAYQAVGFAKAGVHAYWLDPPLPTLHVVSATLFQAGGDADTGSTIQFLLSMSAGVTVTGGTPALILNDDGTATYDSGASDPGNGNLVFDYTIGTADATSNLAITGFEANGAIVQDASADVADFSGPFGAPTGLSINSPLQVIGVASSQHGEVQAGATVELSLALNNSLTVDIAGGVPSLTLDNGATATYDAAESNLAAGTLAFDYIVGTADAVPDLSVFSVNLPNGTTLQDSNGNNADFSAALNQSFSLQIGPAFVSLFTSSQTGAIETSQTTQLTLTMTQPVVVNTASGSPTLTLNDGDTASFDAKASNPATGTLAFDDIVVTGDTTPDLQITQFNANNATIQDTHGVSIDVSGALNYPTGLTVNSPLAVAGIGTSQSGTIGVGQTLSLMLTMTGSAEVNAIDDSGGLPFLSLNDNETASYDGIASTPTLLVFDYIVQPGDYTPDLTITAVNINGASIQDALGNNAAFSAAVNAGTGVDVVACFAAGTRIATPSGDVMVEHLREGDRVVTTLGNGAQEIIWFGHRHIDCARHPKPHTVWPVRIRAHAFGAGRPSRDLLLSPDHAIHAMGALMPVKYLINGTSIAQAPMRTVSYFHLELPQHDVVLANGLAVESYLDTGDRATFSNNGGVLSLYPDFASHIREAAGCAPLVVTGIELEAMRRALSKIAANWQSRAGGKQEKWNR